MGRGKQDTCENCIHGSENKDGTYRCELDRKDFNFDYWCKHHENEEED